VKTHPVQKQLGKFTTKPHQPCAPLVVPPEAALFDMGDSPYLPRAAVPAAAAIPLKAAPSSGNISSPTKEEGGGLRRFGLAPPTAPPATERNNKRFYQVGGYCWTHGYKIGLKHTGTNCKGKADGHKETATRANTMGGSSNNKRWDD
jgi:hypothetical protein